MGNMLLGLTSSDIATINNAAFDEAASTIGNIDGFTKEQLEAWAAKAKQVHTLQSRNAYLSHLLSSVTQQSSKHRQISVILLSHNTS